MSAYREKAVHAWTKESLRLAAAPSAFARESLFYIQEIGHFQAQERYYTEREQLDSYLAVYTVSGSGRLTYRDNTYLLQPHQLFFIDCMEYQHYAAQGDHWELLWVHLNGGSVRGYYEQYAASVTGPVIMMQPESKAASLLRQLIQLNLHKNRRSELLSSKLLVELLTELLFAAQDLSLSTSEIPELIGEVVQELDQHYQHKITLDGLAMKYAISKYHLAKQFKRYTGFSPLDYLIHIRISHAIDMLKYSDLPIADIASKVGIDNVSHFINLFKDRADLTPLAYRKQWQMPK